MSKWRNTCPDTLLTRISAGYEAQLYLLRQTGPTGFLLKEHDSEIKFKVLLGLSHSCDCPQFLREKELCIHIIWIITRKFRVEKDSPLVYQLGLNERELNDVIYGRQKNEKKVAGKIVSAGNERVAGKRKIVETDDICPICQEDIYKTKKSLTYCKFGCGNSIHINCMKIWADHQLKALNEQVIKCPLCRTEFSTHREIVKDYSRAKAREKGKSERQSQTCKNCNSKVTCGQYYRCSTCKDLFVCINCFAGNYHSEHTLEFRKMLHEKWHSVDRRHSTFNLTPSVCRYNLNNSRSEVVAQNCTRGKPANRLRTRLLAGSAGGANSLPDLSLGISGMHIHDQSQAGQGGRATTSLPPLPQVVNKTHRVSSRLRNTKLPPLRKEHSLPHDGISPIISVSSLLRGREGSLGCELHEKS